jgi:hypothetical protein
MLGARGFWGRGRKEHRDRGRDPSRMHEGYMLEVLTRFGKAWCIPLFSSPRNFLHWYKKHTFQTTRFN